MNGQTKATLAEIFKVVLELDEGQDPATLRRIACPAWDSLAHTSIVAAMESEFGVSLSAEDIEFLSSFEAAMALLEEKGL